MRKIVFQIGISLDGYFEGPDADISWHKVDEEFHAFAIDEIRKVDTFLWGRHTYEAMFPYWPNAALDPNSDPSEIEIARLFGNMEKVVFSQILPEVTWENARLERALDLDSIRAMKQGQGRDIMVGGPTLAAPLAVAGLIDEYRFVVMPTVIGAGRTPFEGIKLDLSLESVRQFGNGNVLMTFKPA